MINKKMQEKIDQIYKISDILCHNKSLEYPIRIYLAEYFEDAWHNCPRGDWMLWIASKLQVDERILTLAKGKCAETVIHLMNQRSKDAVKAAIAFGEGKINRAELNKYIYAAAAAAADSYAAYAAYAAAADSYAADTAADSAADSYAADAADATDAAYAATDSYAAYAAYAAAAAVAKKQNQLQTANICREILTNEVFKKLI